MRAVAERFVPRSAPLTDEEKCEATLPDRLEKEAVAAMTFKQRHLADQARQTAFIEYDYQQREKRKKHLGWYWSLKENHRDKAPGTS